MITIEDDFPLEAGLPTAIPISVYDSAHGCEIYVYRAFLEQAEAFAAKFGSEPHTPEALTYLEELFTPLMRERGYLREEEDRGVLLLRLAAYEEKDIRRGVLLPAAEKIPALSQYRKVKLSLTEEDLGGIAYGIALDGVLVSAAWENLRCAEEDRAEITVETAPAFRGRGYAPACAAALSLALLRGGRKVFYLCRTTNRASIRTAEKTGFRSVGSVFYFNCYRR